MYSSGKGVQFPAPPAGGAQYHKRCLQKLWPMSLMPEDLNLMLFFLQPWAAWKATLNKANFLVLHWIGWGLNFCNFFVFALFLGTGPCYIAQAGLTLWAVLLLSLSRVMVLGIEEPSSGLLPSLDLFWTAVWICSTSFEKKKNTMMNQSE